MNSTIFTRQVLSEVRVRPIERCEEGRYRQEMARHHYLGNAAGAILCGMRGYKAIHDWAESLGQKARERFGCRNEKGRYVVPSEFVIRDCLVRIEPEALDQAINIWTQTWKKDESALAIDGKTMKNAVANDGGQTHIMSVIGHDSNLCHTQKK